MHKGSVSMQKRIARGIGLVALMAAIGTAQTATDGVRPAVGRMTRPKIQTPAANWTADSFGPMELVKGAPYSAVKTIEGVRSTADGRRVPQIRPPFRISRDSAGRVRKEVMPLAGVRNIGAPPAIEIDDPVLGVRYSLDTASGVAHRIKVAVRPPLESSGRTAARLVPGPKQPRVVTEKLGARDFGGVSAEGVRTVVTWPVGTVGNNDQPRVITSEKWTVHDLKVVVLWRSSDPESSINETVTEIDRKEPDASLFKIPSDYKIVDDESPQVAHMPPAGPPRM